MFKKLIQFIVTEVINALTKRLEEETKTEKDQADPCCKGCGVVDLLNAETGTVKFCEGRTDECGESP